MQIKVKKLHQEAMVPARQTEGAAGFDVYSLETVVIKPGQTHLLKTGISMELPKGCVALLFPRSSLCLKLHLDMPNSVGVIDEDYRGDCMVGLRNLGTEDAIIEKHERIAQFIFVHYQAPELIEVDELSKTARGEGGFGSTGK